MKQESQMGLKCEIVKWNLNRSSSDSFPKNWFEPNQPIPIDKNKRTLNGENANLCHKTHKALKRFNFQE